MARKKHPTLEADVLFDPAKLAEDAIKANLDPAVFDLIDEGDIVWPRNWFEWVHGSRFLNVSPFAKQTEICTNLYGQFCPRCTDPQLVVTDEHWGNRLLQLPLDMSVGDTQDRVTFLYDGVCLQCGATKPELLESGELSHYLNLAGCAGQRCVAADTMLFTDEGISTIEELRPTRIAADRFQAVDLRVASLNGAETVAHHYTAGIARAVRVTMTLGYQLTGSLKHKVRALRPDGSIQLVKLGDLTLDDAVQAVAPGVWGKETRLPPLDIVPFPTANSNVTIPSMMTEQLARVLGNLVANGCVTSAYTVGFTVSDVAVRDRYLTDTAELFNVTHYRDKQRLEDGASVETITFCSVAVRRFLEQIGLSRTTAGHKQVPKSILQAPRWAAVAFLAGLFDCDGGVYHRKGGKKGTVTYTSVSERLARTVHLLCLNLDIWMHWDVQPSRAFNSRKPLGHDAYSVTTKSLADAKRFAGTIPLVCSYKRNAAVSIVAEPEDRGAAIPNTRQAVIELLDLIQNYEKLTKPRRQASRTRPFRHIRKAGNITRANLKRLLTVSVMHTHTQPYRKLQAILQERGRFLPVRSIESQLDQPLFDLEVPNSHLYVANGLVGHNSSKTVIAGGLIATYQLARYLQLPSPSKYFGLMANQMMHGTFTAVTAGQAGETLWDAFKARVDNGPWFIAYHDFLKHEAIRLGKDALHDVKETFIWYGHKQLSFSFCGPDIRTIRGRTRIMTGIDEIAWFDVKAEGRMGGGIRLNAEETNQALINSLRTIRAASMKLRQQGVNDPPEAINADVSSPSSINDSIMRALRSTTKNRSTYGFHYSTWEMNPNVPLEALRDQMGNQANFERDYAAVPPLGANQFISSIPAVEKCESDQPQTRLVTWQKEKVTDSFGTITTHLSLRPNMRDKTVPRLITIDTGLTNNSFAVMVMSYDRDNRRPVVDVALECMPERDPKGAISVNFPLMYEQVLERLFQNFWICLVVFDRWNCAVGDTYVYSADGMKRLDEMRDAHGVVKHIETLADINGTADTTRWGSLPPQQTYTVTTVGGFRFSGTAQHLLMCEVQGVPAWKCVDELGPQDWVAFRAPGVWPERYVDVAFDTRPPSIRCELCGQSFGNLQRHVLHTHDMPLEQYRKQFQPDFTVAKTGKPVPRFPSYVDEDLSALLGYLTAEGWGPVEFSNANRAVIDHYVGLYNRCFGIEPGLQDGVTKRGEPYWRVLTSSVDIRRYIEHLMPSRRSAQKDVPPVIRRSPRSVIIAYLGALFEGDGSATVTVDHTAYVTLASSSRRLLETVQALLVNFDVFSTVSCEPQKGVYQLSISGVYASRFLEEIGFVTKGVHGARSVSLHETLPTRHLLRRWAATGPDLDGLDRNTAHWLRYRASNIRTNFYYRKLRPWLQRNNSELVEQIDELARFRWRRVKSVVPRAVEPVYDVTIPASDSFIANGFVSHNSIEAVQRIRKEHKIEAVQYSLKWPDFQAVRARILDSTVTLPKFEVPIADVRKDDRPFEQIITDHPATHLALQILTVREGGRKVIKPLNGTDDLFRCLCLGITFLLDPKYTPRFERHGGVMKAGARVPGVVRLSTGAGSVGRPRLDGMTGVGVRKPFGTGRLT